MRDRPNTPKRLGWGLAARLAQRELRGDGGGGTKWGFLPGFRIFLLCLILGIFTISGVGSLSAALVAGMVAQGQSILGGDIDVRLIHRPASAEERDFLSGNGRLSKSPPCAPCCAIKMKPCWLKPKRSMPPIRSIAVKVVRTLAAALAKRDGIYGAVVEQGLLDRLGLSKAARL